MLEIDVGRITGRARIVAVHRADITPAVVAWLVAEQFPQWAGRPVERVEADGWDNATFRPGCLAEDVRRSPPVRLAAHPS